jgi:tetratricopeptide (TPR) repeat protein
MRYGWRTGTLLLLLGLGLATGCHNIPGNVDENRLRPIDQKVGTGPTQEMTAADILQQALAKADKLDRDGKRAEAIAAYEKMREPGNPQSLAASKRIIALRLRDNSAVELDRARQECEKLLLINPNDADLHYHMGEIFCRSGQFQLAEKSLRQAVKYRPDFAQGLANLGMALAQNGEYEESIKVFEKVVTTAEAYCEVAFVLKYQGKREEAMRAYQAAIKADPTLQRAHVGLAQMQQSLQTDPPAPTKVTLTTPYKSGVVELESAPNAAESAGRSMIQRPTLPPLPDFAIPTDREWKSSNTRP